MGSIFLQIMIRCNKGGHISIWDGKDSEKIVDLGTPLTLTGISGKHFVVANDNGIRLYFMDNFQLLKEQKIELVSKNISSIRQVYLL